MKNKPNSSYKVNKIPPNVKCFECNGNHYANNCPKRKNNANSSWKKISPNSNAPTTKFVDGQTYKWCDHCGRWTTSHSTNEHKDRRKKGKSGKTAGNMLSGEVSSTAPTVQASNSSSHGSLSFMGYA
ncbi:MAG: hypothetical protein ACREBR_03970 [bacterium]